MAVEHVSVADFRRQLEQQTGAWSIVANNEATAVVVELDTALESTPELPRDLLPTCPVICFALNEQSAPNFADVVAHSDAELELLLAGINAQPHAATVLVQLLRQSLAVSAADALFAESLAYSTLQHSAGFTAWLADHTPGKPDAEPAPAVLIDRRDQALHLTLNRPKRRNAYSAAMRDALCDALDLARVDSTINQVVLRGAGAAFCAGGDLGEFGEARDAAVAHLSRSSLSAGTLLLQMAAEASLEKRVEVHVEVHGACIGAGIELPAFAHHIKAAADSFFQLPEVSMGLVPGAGGTVSLPRRIGRQRTAWMALTGARVDVATAVEWGLVDEVSGSRERTKDTSASQI